MPQAITALYVHVPYCRRLCGYCDFYSEMLKRDEVPELLAAMQRELGAYRERTNLRPDTIFIGGGTPTVLPAAALDRLLRICRVDSAADADIEFTVEANPATVSDEIAAVLSGAGVNRVSIGAQSFAANELATLDRDHAPARVAETIATCRAHGIRRFSLDLIFGIPGQTLASWRTSLRTALTLDPEHLSCYGLTYEPGTRLTELVRRGAVRPVEADLGADMYEAAIDDLAAAGFTQYEISNFALPGAECRHNLRYWQNEPYVGIGPAAAGYVDGLRYKNVSDTAAYVRALGAGASPHETAERLDTPKQMGETAMLGLRLCAGVDRARFRERFARDPADVFSDAISKHTDAGLLEIDEQAIRLTRRGILLANRVMMDFV